MTPKSRALAAIAQLEGRPYMTDAMRTQWAAVIEREIREAEEAAEKRGAERERESLLSLVERMRRSAERMNHQDPGALVISLRAGKHLEGDNG